MNINGVYGRVARRKPILSKKNIAAVYCLLKTTWISQKVIRTMFFEWMSPKLNFLA